MAISAQTGPDVLAGLASSGAASAEASCFDAIAFEDQLTGNHSGSRLGIKSFSIPSGARRNVSVTLTATGRAILRRKAVTERVVSIKR